MSTGADKSKDSSKKSNGMIIALVVSLVVVILAVILIVVFARKKGTDDAPANDTAAEETQRREVVSDVRTVLDENSGEEIMNQMREEVAEGMFECQMSMTWSFPDGKSASEDAYVANSTNNTHPIYFDVLLDGNEDNVIYSSPVMPVGTELTGFKLDKELEAGTYEATVMYNLLKDTESQEVISSAGFVVTINVLK
jgi:hypothetical protein